MKPSRGLVQRVIERATAVQQIAAPTFHEARRAAYLAAEFTAERLADVAVDAAGNACARLPGRDASLPPLVVSAHIDTVFPLETPLDLRHKGGRLYGAGIGDNALGVAALFGLVWLLREREAVLPGDIWLAGNACEEGLGDLKGMRALVERFAARPLAYLVLEGMGLGEVFHRGLAVQRYRISARTAGGHSWIDYGRPNAVHELAGLVTALAALPLPHAPRTTLNVGRIGGGTSINTIAGDAWLELDLRSEAEDALQALCRQVEVTVRQAARAEVGYTLEVIGRRPAGEIPHLHPLVRLAKESLAILGLPASAGIGSTDANLPLSRGLPAICIGLTSGGGAHTPAEYIDTRPVELGLAHLYYLVTHAWQLPQK